MPTWKRIQEADVGYPYSLSESLALVDWRHPTALVPVTDDVMVIVSDYSGQHKRASHEAYSFLITTFRNLEEWQRTRKKFRNQWLPDGRRISYKQLSERVRRRALIPFLNTASTICGNVITILVDRRIKSFMKGGANAIAKAFPDCFSPKTKAGTTEKMFRLSCFISMLTAGLRRENQRSLWISDDDETLHTYDRREQIARLNSYLTFGMTQWRQPADMEFGTTAMPYVPTWAEDAASIPDLIAGASCQLSRILPTYCGSETWTRIIPSNSVEDARARVIGNWMATAQNQLHQILLRLELDNDGEPHTSAQYFAGTRQSMDVLTSRNVPPGKFSNINT